MNIFPFTAVKCRTCSKPANRTAGTEGPLKKSGKEKQTAVHFNETRFPFCTQSVILRVDGPMSRLLRRLYSLSISKASPANTSIGLVPSGHLVICTKWEENAAWLNHLHSRWRTVNMTVLPTVIVSQDKSMSRTNVSDYPNRANLDYIDLHS